MHWLCIFFVIMNIYCEFQQHVSFTCRHFFSDCTYIRTDETDETAFGGGSDSFENWLRFQQNNWENQFRFLKSFTQQTVSFQNQVRTETSFDITKTLFVQSLTDVSIRGLQGSSILFKRQD